MKEESEIDRAEEPEVLRWIGDNFGAEAAAVVDVQDNRGQVLHLDVTEALDHLTEMDEDGRRRVEAGVGMALTQALDCMQDCVRAGRLPTS